MVIRIKEISAQQMAEYARLPARFQVRSLLQPALVEDGLGGILLREETVARPYWKDYNAMGETPADWAENFDVSHWGFFLAMDGNHALGAAAVAHQAPAVHLLEARHDLSVLWDLRVRP